MSIRPSTFAKYVYDPDWESDEDGTDYDNVILFAGYYRDPETHFYHVRNRFHHAELGRWTARDPLGYADGMNLYEYVRSGPCGYVDPLGLGGMPPLTISALEFVHKPGDKVEWYDYIHHRKPGAMGATENTLDVKVSGKYRNAAPCCCTFSIESMAVNADVHTPGIGTVYFGYEIVKKFRPLEGRIIRWLKHEPILIHERGHQKHVAALAKKYHGVLTTPKECRYKQRRWGLWALLNSGIIASVASGGLRDVQSPALCRKRAAILTKNIKKRWFKYNAKVHGPYDKKLTRLNVTKAEFRRELVKGLRTIKAMKMKDWSCNDTLRGTWWQSRSF